MLVIGHREEIIDQAAEKLRKANPHLMVGIEQAGRKAPPLSDVVVASIQTLAAKKFGRLKDLMTQHTFRVVVLDEAHHAAAPTWRTALVHLGFLPPEDASDTESVDDDADDYDAMQRALASWDARAPRDRFLLGVTATPNRGDAIGLGCVFQTLVHAYGIQQAVADQWLCPITAWSINSGVSLEAVKTTAGEFNQKDLAEAVNLIRRNQLCVTSWQEHAAGRPTIAFTVSVQHALDLASAFQSVGVSARAVSGQTSSEDRAQALQDFRDWRLTVLVNCEVFLEGTDLPMASCILHAKPTRSGTRYVQMSGRGLRIYPGKTECVLIDLVDLAGKHPLQTAPTLYGLPPNLMLHGQPLHVAAKQVEEMKAMCPGLDPATQGRITLEKLGAYARRMDVWAVKDMGEHWAGLRLNWQRIADKVFRLSYPWGDDGHETVTVEPDLLGNFDTKVVSKQGATNGGSNWTAIETVLGRGVAVVQEALYAAEQWVLRQRPSVERLKDRNASWRKAPASEAQLAKLRAWGAPIPQRCTKGQASDMMDSFIARRKR